MDVGSLTWRFMGSYKWGYKQGTPGARGRLGAGDARDARICRRLPGFRLLELTMVHGLGFRVWG